MKTSDVRNWKECPVGDRTKTKREATKALPLLLNVIARKFPLCLKNAVCVPFSIKVTIGDDDQGNFRLQQ
jgi:hypothetical protein